ncbi:MAG TPA: hypothetical protein VK789_21130 [Bryobacteraceae bacterium]|jgi:hypothetical protein|nr:hypothetical protein [Bryobacteraceae bacterium]
MSIEIHQAELERRVREGIQSGQFHDVDELLTKALDALSKSSRSAGTLDWSQCPALESVPGKVSGAWVFRNTRIPVAAVFENLEDRIHRPQFECTGPRALIRILFDQGTPVAIAGWPREHTGKNDSGAGLANS